MTEKNEPTEAQIKKFWEWCGLKQARKYDAWYDPNLPEGEPCGVFSKTDISTIDLNNLFEYAVPKLIQELGRARVAFILQNWVHEVAMHGKDPAVSLFYILEVINE